MKRLLLVSIAVSIAHTVVRAQTPTGQDDWQQKWGEDMVDDILENDAEDSDEDGSMDAVLHMEMLQQLAAHPMNINTASREELEQLPFLSDQQVMDLIAHRDRYGAVRSTNELLMIKSFDFITIQRLKNFAFFGDITDDSSKTKSIGELLSHSHHTLQVSGRLPLYRRKGDINGYLGYPYRHTLRYELNAGNSLRAGFIASQDAGEPFFTANNRWGYDTYSYYVQLKNRGRWENVVVGKYKISSGMGVALGNGFSLGKTTALQSRGRNAASLRPHISRSDAGYLQGAAATIRLFPSLSLTAFASCRLMDATLNDNGTVKTISSSGYHRTPSEMKRKNQLRQDVAGAVVSFKHNALRLSLNTVYTHYDRRLSPDKKQLYRRWQAEGNSFLTTSLSYDYRHSRFSFNGETAIDDNGAVATLNSLNIRITESLDAMLLQRFYSYRFVTIHGHSFSEGGKTQNESGLYAGVRWSASRKLTIEGYGDIAYFPWARYRISQPSYAYDFMTSATYVLNRNTTLSGRYRLHLRQLDNKEKSTLRRHNEHRVRLQLDRGELNDWSFRLQADYVRAVDEEIANGWMGSGRIAYTPKTVQTGLGAAYFNTDSYAARLYAYERQMPQEFAFPSFFGRGVRLWLFVNMPIGSHLQFTAKGGYTKYFDRSVISSGLQQINHSSMTDLEGSIVWKF